MKDLLEFIAKSMVNNPDAVEVTVNEKETATVLQLHVAEEDMGKVIGKQGRIAKAMRTVMKAAASNENKKIIVDKIMLTELHEITLLKEYPKTASDIECKTIISSDKSKFSVDNFLFWIDEPSNLTENINNPFYEIIKFLNGYTKELFKTDRYLFYSKPDNDYTWILNIYAYDFGVHPVEYH